MHSPAPPNWAQNNEACIGHPTVRISRRGTGWSSQARERTMPVPRPRHSTAQPPNSVHMPKPVITRPLRPIRNLKPNSFTSRSVVHSARKTERTSAPTNLTVLPIGGPYGRRIARTSLKTIGWRYPDLTQLCRTRAKLRQSGKQLPSALMRKPATDRSICWTRKQWVLKRKTYTKIAAPCCEAAIRERRLSERLVSTFRDRTFVFAKSRYLLCRPALFVTRSVGRQSQTLLAVLFDHGPRVFHHLCGR